MINSPIRPHNAADPKPDGIGCPTRPTALASVDARRPALQRAASASGTPFVTDCLSSAPVRSVPVPGQQVTG